MTTTRTDEQLDAARADILARTARIRSGDFAATPSRGVPLVRLRAAMSRSDEMNDAVPNYDIVNPDPAALVESLRAFGYTTATAIADLIDNSITARAKNVWVEFYWDGPDSWIRIDDDGVGMTEQELIAAMRPGSEVPRDERDPRGSWSVRSRTQERVFSQCRLLTVRTRAQGVVAARSLGSR